MSSHRRRGLRSIGATALVVVIALTCLRFANAGPAHAAAATVPGVVWAWGADFSGQFGNGTATATDQPVPAAAQMPAGVTFTAISTKSAHVLALDTQGHAWAWGDNSYGDLGNSGASVISMTPVPVAMPAGVTFTAISAAKGFSVALDTQGNAWAWGVNNYGQLGNGGTANSTTPVPVSMPAGVTFTAISSGYSYAVALDTLGNAWTWGDNGCGLGCGSLGIGTQAIDSLTPVKVVMPAGVTFTAISAGDFDAFALDAQGNAWGWGVDAYGAVGVGCDPYAPPQGVTNCHVLSPVAVKMPVGVTFTSISGGEHETLALDAQGRAWAWGYDFWGALGNGTSSASGITTDSAIPVAVTMPAGVTFTTISAGRIHNLALDTQGHAWAWGYNQYGGLGTGSTYSAMHYSTVPMAVTMPAGVTFTAVTGGDGDSLALQPAATAPSITTQPTDQTVCAGSGVSFSAAATGAPDPALQWQSSADGGATWSPIDGATASPLAFTAAAGQSGVRYRGVFTNAGGTATTSSATLTVNTAPAITTQPTNQVVLPGQTATFSAIASGQPASSVQWQASADGGATWSPISGATSPTLAISGVSAGQSGTQYQAVFTNGCGSATSQPATLGVLVASLALNLGPQYTAGGTTYVTSATTFAISGTVAGTGDAIQSVSYCFAPANGACGGYTTVQGSSATFQASGADGAYVLSAYATDANGLQSATRSLPVTLDNTAPRVAFSAPTDGATYTYGQAVTVGYTCDDGGGSGVATCAGDLANGSALPTSGLGLHSFAVNTSDNLGHSSAATATYGVTCSNSGVLQPINADGSSIFKLGRVVPLKQQLQGSCAGLGSAQLTVYVAKVSNDVTGTQVEAISTSAADSGNTMRYDPTSGQYLFNLGTGSLTTGTYRLSIYIGGTNATGVLLNSVQFSLK